MSNLVYRYPLDPDGNKPDNLVSDERHVLSAKTYRVVATDYGLFFNDSMVVRDVDANRVLDRSEYSIIGLNGEATAKFGKALSECVLITNTAVSENVALTYQVLGGLYTNSGAAVATMYETWLLDDRAVDWTKVFNKQPTYPPSLHRHILQDVYGFEPLVVGLERIRNALVMQDIPVFEALIDYVSNIKINEVSEVDLLSINAESEGVVTMRRLVQAMRHLNFNSIHVSPNSAYIRNGARLDFRISTTALPDNERLYWRIKHINTTSDDFAVTAGSVLVFGNEATFSVQLGTETGISDEGQERFQIEIHRESVDGPLLHTTGTFIVAERSMNSLLSATLACCFNTPRLRRTATNAYIAGRS